MGGSSSRLPTLADLAEHPIQLQPKKPWKLQTITGVESPGFTSSDEMSSSEDEGGVYYDLRLLRENILIIRHYMHWSGSVLVDIRPYFPRWVYRLGKPWISLNHEEAFLFFYALSLSLHFAIITIGYALTWAVPRRAEPIYEYTPAQFVVEACMIVLTLLLFVYPKFKCYLYVYVWVCAKAFYWSSHLYSIFIHYKPLYRNIEGPLRLGFDMYVTIAMLMHSMVDYARLNYTHAVLQEILKEEMKITGELVIRDKLGDIFFEDL